VNRAVTPAGIAPPAARYAHAVLSEPGGRMLHTSGVVPIRPDGTVPDDLGEQVATVWANLSAILAEAGMDVTDVVSITTYVVGGQDLATVMAGRDAFMAGHLAASTLVPVATLARPEWLVEIALIAVSAVAER
jgi:enamine deaminase RidA (YjgF/YER057c/UK114 family)